jgi:hypothetical protein
MVFERFVNVLKEQEHLFVRVRFQTAFSGDFVYQLFNRGILSRFHELWFRAFVRMHVDVDFFHFCSLCVKTGAAPAFSMFIPGFLPIATQVAVGITRSSCYG